MDRLGERRRSGSDRRRRAEIVLPWQDPVWDMGWDGPERRISERRADRDRRHALPRTDEPECYSDDWARARGAANFIAWLDQSAKILPLGLPGRWSPPARSPVTTH